jgi:dihydrodipicolinate synthase/N-acetylneuraminate lyase
LGSFKVVMREGLKLRGIDVGNTLKPIKPLSVEAREKLKKIINNVSIN